MFRGECLEGGIKLTGYDTDEERYCAIRGGEVDTEEGTCKTGENICSLADYFTGNCK